MSLVRIRLCFAAFVVTVICGASVAAGASDIATVVNSACIKCHSPKRVCLMLGVKSREAWQGTVRHMVAKGAKVPAERVDEAADYLAGLPRGAAPFCQ